MIASPLPSPRNGGAAVRRRAAVAASVDLSGMDYDSRRRRLFTALRSLHPGDEVDVVSERADDVGFLRYEWEARTSRRLSWSLPQEDDGTTHVTVRIPEQRR